MKVSKKVIALTTTSVATYFFMSSISVNAKTARLKSVPNTVATAEQLDNRFFNCTAAKKAGFSNIKVSPGYIPKGWKHTADRDRDGIACESRQSFNKSLSNY